MAESDEFRRKARGAGAVAAGGATGGAPLGREELRPLDFEEFLWAMGKDALASEIREHFASSQPYEHHAEAMELYRRYLMVGGIPAAVRAWRDAGDYAAAREELAAVDAQVTVSIDPQVADGMGVSAPRTWKMLPQRVARGVVEKRRREAPGEGGAADAPGEHDAPGAHGAGPFEWLRAAGLVATADETHDVRTPLAPSTPRPGARLVDCRAYLFDTGLLFHKLDIDPKFLADEGVYRMLGDDKRRALTENFVAQQLVANGARLLYWTPPETSVRGRIEFLLEVRTGADETANAQVVPVEVKFGRSVSGRLRQRFMVDSGAAAYVRLADENFCRTAEPEGYDLVTVPLYAAFCLA